MKFDKMVSGSLIGIFLLIGLQACSTPPKRPDTEEIRKRADEGTQDLRMEEEHHKQ